MGGKWFLVLVEFTITVSPYVAIYDVVEEKLETEPDFQYIPEKSPTDPSHLDQDAWRDSMLHLKEGLNGGTILAQFDVSKLNQSFEFQWSSCFVVGTISRIQACWSFQSNVSTLITNSEQHSNLTSVLCWQKKQLVSNCYLNCSFTACSEIYSNQGYSWCDHIKWTSYYFLPFIKQP